MFDYQSVSKVSIFLSVELLMLEYSPGLTPSSRMVCGSGTGLLPPRNSCYFLQKNATTSGFGSFTLTSKSSKSCIHIQRNIGRSRISTQGQRFHCGVTPWGSVPSPRLTGLALVAGVRLSGFSLCWIYIIWRFPEMGVPPNDLHRIFHYKPSSYWGTPIYGNPHMIHMYIHTTIRDG